MIKNIKRPEGMRAAMESVIALYEEPDRGAGIMAAANLDDCLKELIASFMNIERLGANKDSLKNKLFDGTGPLSTFSARIDLAYAFSWIDEASHYDLHIIRWIRNQFAHFSYTLSFSTPEISAQCRNFKFGKASVDTDLYGLPASDEPRHIFLYVTALLQQQIISVTMENCSMPARSARAPID